MPHSLSLLILLLSCLICLPSPARLDEVPSPQLFKLNNSWAAPFPDAPLPLSNQTANFIQQNWRIPKNGFLGGANTMSFVPDPISTTGGLALKIAYPMGSYSPSGAKKPNGAGVEGGAHFYTQPFAPNAQWKSALLSYWVGFPSNFPWVKGGKLPGIYGGEGGEGCSGGMHSYGDNCFSMRMMWRNDGESEAYAYVPESEEFCSDRPTVICNEVYGTSIARGEFEFSLGAWNKIDMFISMNDPGKSNGVLKVWLNNTMMVDKNNVPYRTTDALGVSRLMFSTFFGGATPDWATPIDTFTAFRDIQLSVGEQRFSSAHRAMGLSWMGTIAFTMLACIGLLI
ncbi:uncharacterized protein VTP21DRAFT_6507 [Calcarisporiella thermophila]|uniref:uncharacterized protein n=1 Tax=Calcarisporiella thermophila TaxID=911321 RepID=UPI0037428B5A